MKQTLSDWMLRRGICRPTPGLLPAPSILYLDNRQKGATNGKRRMGVEPRLQVLESSRRTTESVQKSKTTAQSGTG